MARATNKSPVKGEFFSLLKEIWRDLKEKVITEAWDRRRKEIYEAKNRFSGEAITKSLQSSAQIREFADDDGIPGLLQPGYVPLKVEA